jgi:hypothetical protein
MEESFLKLISYRSAFKQWMLNIISRDYYVIFNHYLNTDTYFFSQGPARFVRIIHSCGITFKYKNKFLRKSVYKDFSGWFLQPFNLKTITTIKKRFKIILGRCWLCWHVPKMIINLPEYHKFLKKI